MASYQAAQSLLNRGVSRPTLYSVELPQSFISRQTNDYINFFCAATTIPEVRTTTAVAMGHEMMGVTREQPTSVEFGKPFTITVIENSDFRVYKEMRAWFDLTAQQANQATGNRNIRMNYYNTYVSDMELIKLEYGNNPDFVLPDGESNYKQPLRIRFLNAYPVAIGPISLASSDYDSFTSFTIDFSYESYSISGSAGIGQIVSDTILNFAGQALDAIF